ncbi:Cytochrome c551/c552 [Anaerohalosphaera lusitana]|uniref:Cytochrome c551/c552 n=2 Tax=Anaerohalosphaera lusitana TaxID=1936003 RepID=A0A1U9NPC4_9BACT|nr:Cytochrome c551/c552 [Anaerohalosphaera lusitana]
MIAASIHLAGRSHANQPDDNPAAHILIYTRNGKGFVHKNIDASVACLENICKTNNWTTHATDDAAVFDTDLSRFDVIVFSNTNNQAFTTDDQRSAFQTYIRQGGAFVGIHSACGSERSWPWFWANVGGKFKRHPPFQPFDIKVIDSDNPATETLPAVWKWEDECYYLDNLNPDIHVLLAADMTTVKDSKKDEYPGKVFGNYFPLAWCHQFDGGRQFYTALGHDPKHYKDKNFINHLTGGIKWALDEEAVADNN